MPIKIKSQRDYLVTEATLEASSTNLNDLDHLLKASRGTARITALYGQGGVIGISIEQKCRISDKVSEEVRALVGVGTKELDCE